MSSTAELIPLVRDAIEADHSLDLEFGEFRVHVATNDDKMRDFLAHYFRPFLADPGRVDTTVTALQMAPPDLKLDFQPWPRDPGKTGFKDSYVDFEDGRACRKVRTGMQYLLSGRERLIFGDCLGNDSQVVNFVIAQYMNWLIHRGWVPCHAAAISQDGAGLAIGANAGGGKSTLALRLVADGYDFASNDRTLIRARGGRASLNGVPKQPRINPGTVLHNPALIPVIGEARREELATMPPDELRHLEEKYDADVAALFGDGRFQLSARLDAMVILSWDWGSDQPPRFDRVDLAERRDLLTAIMKPPGVFYLPRDGHPPNGVFAHDPEDFFAALEPVPIYEVTGGVDFDAAMAGCRTLLSEPETAPA